MSVAPKPTLQGSCASVRSLVSDYEGEAACGVGGPQSHRHLRQEPIHLGVSHRPEEMACGVTA